MNISKLYILLFFTAYLSCLCFGQTSVKNLTFDSLSRSYRLHLPLGYDESRPVPLVLNFHGLNSSALLQEAYTQMSVAADAEGFMVVYPEGIDQRWNVKIGELENDSIDDVGFVVAILDTLMGEYNIDTNRIYATGMSLGGFMSYRLACELSDRISAITSVAGLMSQELLDICQPERPIPILHIHGTQDNVVAYNGDEEFLSVDAVMAFWRSINSCELIPQITIIPDRDPNDGSTVLKLVYACEAPAELVLFSIENGGHTWPGGIPLPNAVTNYDIDGTQESWTFLQKHRLDGIFTSLDETPLTANQLIVFPNPFHEQVSVRSRLSIQKIELYDNIGKLIHFSSIHQQQQIMLKMPSLAPGVYSLHLHTLAGRQQVQLLKCK